MKYQKQKFCRIIMSKADFISENIDSPGSLGSKKGVGLSFDQLIP